MGHRVAVPTDDVLVNDAWISHFGEDGLLRRVAASIEALLGPDANPARIGHVQAIIAWRATTAIFDDADGQEADAGNLAATACAIMEAHPRVRSVLLIERLVLDPPYRGNRLSATIVAELARLVGLRLATCAVVLDPVPLDDRGHPIAPGPEHDAALVRLTAAYRAAGFEPWSDEDDNWWLPIGRRRERR